MSVRIVLIIILVLCVLEITVNAEENDRCANVKNPFVGFRKKRHLIFPVGTNFVQINKPRLGSGILHNEWVFGLLNHADQACWFKVRMSVLQAIMVHAPSGWNVIVELDVLFPLPSSEMINALFGKKLHHRQKREFWEKMESAIGSYNLNGRSCIYRSICEVKRHLAPPGKSLVHDILRAIFSAPVHDHEFREEVNEVYSDLLEPNFCERIHDCPISLLEAFLGLNKNII